MNKTITLALAVVLFLAGAFVGNKIGSKDGDTLYLKSGTAMYEEPTAYADYKMLAKNLNVNVLEKVKFGAPSMVYVNDNLNVKAGNGETYRLKQGSFFKFIGVNEADDMVTIFANADDDNNVQLEVPKQKVYPVDEGQWARVRDSSLGERWVRIKSTWYDNI